MSSRLFLSFLAAGAIALACGPRTHSAEVPAAHTHMDSGKPLASSLDVAVGDQVSFTLQLTNSSSKRQEIDFPSGQTHDFAVQDSTGRTIWRWSDGRMFTQALQTKPLDAGETMSYDEKWDPAGLHGRYTVVARLNSTNFPLEKRVEFVLP